jgi:HAD superfamily hydrolase (TIGR01509 family)
MNRPKGIILDVDGTLVDSNEAHARAWAEALTRHGHTTTVEQVRPLIGMGGDKILPRLSGIDKDTPEGEQISSDRMEIFKTRYLPQLNAFPQTRQLLERMKRDGMTLVVASSAQEDELDPLLELAGAHDYIEAKTSGSDVEQSKPAPDIVEAALHKLALPANDVIMLGDTPYDIEAAGKLAIRVIAFRGGGFSDEDLKNAVAIYNDPADLLANYDTSPVARHHANTPARSS